MPIEAEIEGIGILEFPDGTSNEVIQSAAKRIIAQRAAAKPATIPQVEAAAVVGSTAQLNQAVQDASKVGMMERFVGTMGQLGEPVGMLSPMEGGRIAPSGEFTPLGAAEARGMRRGAALGAAMIPSALAAPFTAGMGVLPAALVESGVSLAGQAASQAISPEPYRAGELVAAAIPGIPVAQRATKLGQFGRELISGATTSGAQAGIEAALGDDTELTDVLLRTGIGGFLSPAASITFRGIGAAARAKGINPRQVAAEFQRPFTQQFIQDRATEISKELERQGAAGLAASSADQIARTLYSPNSGLNPQQFSDQIKQVVSNAFNQGRSSGLSQDELASAIKTELGKAVQGAEQRAGDAVDEFVRQTQQLTDRATNIADRKLASRDARLTNLLRSVEGRVGVESQQVQDQIDLLQRQKATLPVESVERQRIDSEIANLNQQVQDIEAGRVAGFGPAAGITKEQLGLQVQEAAQQELDVFKKQREEGYSKLRPELEQAKVSVTEVTPTGEEVTKEYTVNQLRDRRTKILRAIDFNKPVQKADYSVFQKLDEVNSQIDQALESNPALKTALQDENRLYREGISRFKGFFADKILREAGEAGGMPGIVGTISGASGAQNLKLLQNLLGERYERVKPNLRQYVYTQIRGNNPNQFLETIAKGQGGSGTGIQKEVIEELFPDLSEINEVASKYNTLINQRSKLESDARKLKSQIDDLTKQVDEGVAGAEARRAALQKQLDSSTAAISSLKAKNVSERENQIIESLGKVKAAVDKAGASKRDALEGFQLDQIVKNLSTDTGVPLYKALEEAVTTTEAARDRFFGVVKKALAPGGQLENFQPSNLVDFLMSKGDEASNYRSQRFLKTVGESRPDLVADAQNLLIGRIIAESVDGNKIDTKKMASLVGTKDAPGRYYGVTQGLLGGGGVEKMNRIAQQLSEVSDLGKPSVFSSMIAPAIAGGIGYQMYGPIGLGTGLGGYAAYSTMRKGIEEGVQAAIGRIVKTPEYLDIVSKPIDAATKGQLDRFERLWPRILKLEQDRFQMNKEEVPQ